MYYILCIYISLPPHTHTHTHTHIYMWKEQTVHLHRMAKSLSNI